jgi:sigma-B regulation protein RsbU (phosphoserine phosphatase)
VIISGFVVSMSDPFTTPCILVADDQPDVVDALRLVLKAAGFAIDAASSIASVRERLLTRRYDLVLMDLNYASDTTSGREGLELLAEALGRDPLLPVIVMTGWGTIETAVEAMRRGARTFVHKPWDNDELVRTVRREVDDGQARRRAGALASREREDARLIQRALLPQSLPTVPGCEIAALWEPATDFGGDCYDVLRLGGGRLGVSIADVTGKGLPAALLMSNLQALVRAFAAEQSSPRYVAAGINRALCSNPALRMFVTFFYAVIDNTTRTLTFTNAGHNPPILVRANGSVERLSNGGLVLGVKGSALYEQGETRIITGDRIVLFTDGLNEAENGAGVDFGDDRLVETVVSHRDQPAAALLEKVFAQVREFTGGRFADDATLITVAIR